MAEDQGRVDVYLESGQKRILAVAVDWPGWCRGGKDEESALAALLEAAPRYAAIVRPAGLEFEAPARVEQLQIGDRVGGNASADMGVPAVVLENDSRPLSDQELERAKQILQACWHAFDRAIEGALGRELRKGPRGGGRELESIARHVLEAEGGYSDRIGLKLKFGDLGGIVDMRDALRSAHQRILEWLPSVATIGTPPPGPRGGARWPARYYVRRVAYHVVDHTWEIEDRLQPAE